MVIVIVDINEYFYTDNNPSGRLIRSVIKEERPKWELQEREMECIILQENMEI